MKVCFLGVALCFAQGICGAEQAESVSRSRMVAAIHQRIHAAQVMPNDLAKLTAHYAADFWPLAVEKELVLDEQTTCMAVIGQRCVLAAQGNKVRIFDVKTGQKKDIVSPHGTPITAMTHQADFVVITGDEDGDINCWSLKTSFKYHIFSYAQPVCNLVSMDHLYTIVSAASDRLCYSRRFPGTDFLVYENRKVNCLLRVDNGVAVGLGDGSIFTINARTMDIKLIAEGRKQPVTALARISSSKIAAQYDRGIHIIDMGENPIMGERLAESGDIQHLTALEDELVGIGNWPRRGPAVICRFKHGSKHAVADTLELEGRVQKVAASPAGNWFAAAAEVLDISGEAANLSTKHKIYIVQRVGDEVAEEKIDDEFVQWMNEQAVRPVVEKRPKKKKPWYACG